MIVGAVVVEGEDMALSCDRAGGCGAGGVVPVDDPPSRSLSS